MEAEKGGVDKGVKLQVERSGNRRGKWESGNGRAEMEEEREVEMGVKGNKSTESRTLIESSQTPFT